MMLSLVGQVDFEIENIIHHITRFVCILVDFEIEHYFRTTTSIFTFVNSHATQCSQLISLFFVVCEQRVVSDPLRLKLVVGFVGHLFQRHGEQCLPTLM